MRSASTRLERDNGQASYDDQASRDGPPRRFPDYPPSQRSNLPVPVQPKPTELLPMLETLDLSLLGAQGNAAFNLLERIQAEWRQSRERGNRQSLVLDFIYQRIAVYATAELRTQVKEVAHEERLADIGHAQAERVQQNEATEAAAIDAFEKLVAVSKHVTGGLEELRKSNPIAAKMIEVHVNHIFTSLQALAVVPSE